MQPAKKALPKIRKPPKHELTQSQSVIMKEQREKLVFDNLISSYIKATFLHK